MLKSLETIPLLGQLLLAFNSMTRHYPAWQVAAGSVFMSSIILRIRHLLLDDVSPLAKLKKIVFGLARDIPMVANQIKEAVDKTSADLEKSMIKMPADWKVSHALPQKRMATTELTGLLENLSQWQKVGDRVDEGKVSGTIYTGGPDFAEYTKLMNKSASLFQWSNPLHPGVFPGVRQMEAEVVKMTLALFNGGVKNCGVVTSGGTESIIMALKAYRDHGIAVRGITKPNIVLPRTAHPAFDKGCQYFGISMRKVHEDEETREADYKAMAAAADSNTIAFVGSVPQYPHGSVDNIKELAKISKKFGAGLHVDCCLGSFLVPFMRLAGFDFPEFDFRVNGVTSISCDTHKYGLAPKGTSVLMYSSTNYRKYQYSVFPDWPGGIYGTPSVAGSRSGSVIASTWAALMHHGVEGYVDNCKSIVTVARKIATGIQNIPGLKLVCDSRVSVVAWTSDVFDINRLVTGIVEEKGWDLNVLQFPSAMHIAVTMAHINEGIAEKFVSDLAECTAVVMQNPSLKVHGSAALYGMTQAIPDRSIIEDVVKVYIDTMTKVVELPAEEAKVLDA